MLPFLGKLSTRNAPTGIPEDLQTDDAPKPARTTLTDLPDDVMLDLILMQGEVMSCESVLRFLVANGIPRSINTEALWEALCRRKGWTTNPFTDAPGAEPPFKGSWRHHFSKWCELITKVQKGKVQLLHLPLAMRSDRAIVLAAVTQDADALWYASAALKNDREIVLAAVKQDGNALIFASKTLCDDPEIVITAVQQYGQALWYASDYFKSDSDVVLAAVRQNAEALRFASKRLRGDRKIVLAAVTQLGRVLYYASDALKNDREVVLAAVTQNAYALKYASDALRKDAEIRAVAKL